MSISIVELIIRNQNQKKPVDFANLNPIYSDNHSIRIHPISQPISDLTDQQPLPETSDHHLGGDPPTDDFPENGTQSHWDPNSIAPMQRLEAVLFMSRRPLASRKISQLAHLEDGTQARTMIKQLNERYDQAGRAFHIKKVAGGYQLLTRPQFSSWIRRFEHIPHPLRLSTSALETLTVVAYRQPITKAEIEAIRGISSGEMLRQLLDSNLIKIVGRSEKLGRAFLYATSKDFLTGFGFNSLKDLPRASQLVGQGLPEWAQPKQSTFPNEKFEDTIEPSADDEDLDHRVSANDSDH